MSCRHVLCHVNIFSLLIFGIISILVHFYLTYHLHTNPPMQGQYHTNLDCQNNTSQFVIVSGIDAPSFNASSEDIETQMAKDTTPALPCQYAIRTQSSYLHDDESTFHAHDINRLLAHDLTNRITQVGESIAGLMFPDSAFGFPINDQFVGNFYGSFVSPGGILDPQDFPNDSTTAVFLNRMISTIAHFLDATEQVSLKPLRYFTAVHSTKVLEGHAIRRKPDNMLVRLINGYLRETPLRWCDSQALIEHTREKKPPIRLPETINIKSYLTFCSQPERDYVVSLCITGQGFHIVVTDHVGQIETDIIPFKHNVSTMIFVRMVMGLAFLPDIHLGVDTTITRHEVGKPSNRAFSEEYKPFTYGNGSKPSILLFACSPSLDDQSPTTPVSPDSENEINTISIGRNVYKVMRLLFRTQTLIGRATRAFLVQFPDKRCGVLKDSWITMDREREADFLQGLDIPYGPELVDHCILSNTDIFRKHPIMRSLNHECRQKRRIVTYPAGVHISDFTSLWELMLAFFDVVLCMSHFLLYTRLLFLLF
jgi:Fungal protein kinase